MSRLFVVLLTFMGGIVMTIQPSINAKLAQKTGVIESALISFAIGTLTLILIVSASGSGTIKGIVDAKWWELSGGVMGAFFVAVITCSVPRIGTTASMAIIIAAQLTIGILLDHFGMFGFKSLPIDLKRLMGILMMGIGIFFILKK
ncbi:Putative inner membrane exporter, YdcZ-like [Desulfonema limicola]|uniref:Inner membrane exporter, YdcZ-like n=1 Tax=Desulfonema limicola TaxID=45656 RepID=A0A975GI22_9BACT|nr:DMT family transporter [Desulfonema limicola]QTA82076.1 Putative inner membrane exporter, YdcZ-like [Desulfonema limicola]